MSTKIRSNRKKYVGKCGGGWIKTKKVGRDDFLIEQDRKIAIKQRKTRTIIVEKNETSSLIKQRKINGSSKDFSPNNNRHEKKDSFQRHLFSKEKSRSSSNNVSTVNKKKDKTRKSSFCKRDKYKITTLQRHSIFTEFRKDKKYGKKRGRERKIITPEKLDYSSDDSANNHNNIRRRRRRKSPILFSKDFGKSAKYLYETTQRRKFTPNEKNQREQDGQTQIVTKEIDHLPFSINEPRQLRPPSNHYIDQFITSLRIIKPQQRQQNSIDAVVRTSSNNDRNGNSNGNVNNDKHLPIRSLRHNDFVRNLLLGPEKSYCTNEIQMPNEQIEQNFITTSGIDKKTDHENSQISMTASDPLLCVAYSSKRRNTCNNIGNKKCNMQQTTTSLIIPNSKSTSSKTQQHLGTQLEFTVNNQQEIENTKEVEQERSEKSLKCTSFKKYDVNNYCKLNLSFESNNGDENDHARNENQSMASSVMISLPRNASFSLPFAAIGDNNGDDDDDDDADFIEEYHYQNPTQNITIKASPLEDEEAVGRRARSDMDPLVDIEYWQMAIEKEKDRRNVRKIGDFSFQHTIASIILAKNAKKKGTENDNYCSNCLWLPSILEGGIGIGLDVKDWDPT
mmetsp:Transcript_24535/g.28041  ORF Transcript_24535/g.28041 Transcript_24535/m.28041 type:complete len:620 (+) Transcript_24535:94-1953(+)